MNTPLPQTFSAPWGKMLKGTSLFIALVFAAMLLADWHFLRGPKMPPLMWPVSAFGILAVMLGALPFVVRSYTVTAEGILIHRLWWNTALPLADILSAEVMPSVMSKSIRTFGNGGMFSFNGFYWNKRLGNYKAYVNDLNRTVVVRTKKRTAVLSPDDPQAFVDAVNALVTPP